MLLDPETLDLAPSAPASCSSGSTATPRFKLELPPAQLEIVTPPRGRRRRARAASSPAARARAARAPPRAWPGRPPPACTRSAPPEGALNAGAALRRAPRASTGRIARRQLVFALQVHVAVGGADRALAVYNALRALPARARGARRQRAVLRRVATAAWPRSGRRSADAAPAPGRAAGDRQLGRARATSCAGARAPGAVPDPGCGGGSCARTRRFGTLELRVPDAQTTRRRRGGGRRRRARARRLAGRAPRRRRARSPAADLADRGEPLVGLPPRRRGHARRPRHGERAPDARAPARAARRARARRRAARRAARELEQARGGSSSATARCASGRWRASAGCAGWRAWLAERFVPGRVATPMLGRGRQPAMATLPRARGPLERAAARAAACAARPAARPVPRPRADPLADDDLQLALYCCYELHYRGFAGRRRPLGVGAVAARRPRGGSRQAFEDALLRPSSARRARQRPPDEMDLALRAIADADDGPSLSRYLERQATLDAGARVPGPPLRLPAQGGRPALVGAAAPARRRRRRRWSRSRPTSTAAGGPSASTRSCSPTRWRRSGLDATYGAYLDAIPGVTLATVNLMSLFGLHRRWRGAIVGHLALFEMTSSIPNRRYANGLRRLGFDGDATEFFDEHVEADAVHENIAAVDLAGGLARQEPALGPDVLWGARALVAARRALGRRTCSTPGRRAAARCARPLAARAVAWPRVRLVARARPRARSARGSARACACRRRTAGCATSRSGTARPSRGRPGSRCRPGPDERAAHEQRTVAVGRDRGDLAGSRLRHPFPLPSTAPE